MISWCFVQQTVPLPASPSMGRKWVGGADSSHTELSVIVLLCVTSTPQRQQPLINPTVRPPTTPCPLVASPTNFVFISTFFLFVSVCLHRLETFLQPLTPCKGCIQTFYRYKMTPLWNVVLLMANHNNPWVLRFWRTTVTLVDGKILRLCGDRYLSCTLKNCGKLCLRS